LKLLKRKNSNTYSNSAIGLLGTLLGLNNTQQSTGGLFSSLLGGSSYSQPNNLFGSLFGTNSGYNTYYNSNNNSGLGSFLGLTGNSNSNNSSLQSLLNFVNGNYNNNSQYSLLYNILSSAASSIVSDSGNVSASGLFSVLNQLLQS
ncbi:MAG: hypothetical protein IJH64_11705, partial [Oscillospiraceae bacterium]|nr:hypothetical protein [Oscillospiraceae bacterium]